VGSKKDSKYKHALEKILEVWEAHDCLHTCRWGNKTVEICADVLLPIISLKKDAGKKKDVGNGQE
jgi:hypothetical protein